MSDYRELYRRSIDDPGGFWMEVAEAADWQRKPGTALDDSDPPFIRWFPDGEINVCHNALDRHVDAGHGDRLAVIHDSPVTDSITRYTYRELRDAVATFAGVLAGEGVERGDRVVIYMPMVPEAMIAMLACARIGAVHSVVFGGFAARELAVRIDDCRPRLLVSASCGIEPSRVVEYKPLLDKALDIAEHPVSRCIVLQRDAHRVELDATRDRDWSEAMAAAEPVDCAVLASTDPLYILYTSGTTGRPKGVVRDTGGTVVSLDWTMPNIYDIHPGDVFWAASDIGWVVGHSYIVYGPLLHGATTIMYEGKPVGTPDPGAFWRVIAEHGVKSLFTAPTAIRAIRKEDPKAEHLERHDIGTLESLYLAGERCDPDTLAWSQDVLRVPVIDHWWQTETAWSICANPRGIEPLPVVPGSPTVAAPGHDVQALDGDGKRVAPGEVGALCVKLPLPPGTFIDLWNASDRYRSAYFEHYPGFYETGDAGYLDENGYVFVMGRTDDVINVAGHRLSTGALEEAIAGHDDVAECAVMGIDDPTKGELPVGFVILSAGVDRDPDTIRDEIVQRVRDEVGPVAAFRKVAIVDRLPKTRSGKILRATMRAIANGEDWNMPATIEDPAVLGEIETVLADLGYPRRDDS